MKYIKTLLAVSLISTSALANNIECRFDVRGYDMTERSPAIFFEDSYQNHSLQTTSEACVILAIQSMKNFKRVPYKVKGKTFSYEPGGLHVEISIDGHSVVVDRLNGIAESDQCINTKKAFEFGSNPYSADFAHNTDCH